MNWDILGSNTFWLQMSLSIHGWTKDLQPMFQIWQENEFSDKKWQTLLKLQAYYSLVNSGKSNLATMEIVMKTDLTVFRLM
jgi:hypothetical protein